MDIRLKMAAVAALCAALLTGTAMAGPMEDYTAVLQARIAQGASGLNTFDYAAAKAAGELSAVTAYVNELAAMDPDAMSAADATAYWANLYNALTVQVVLENYPVTTIKKIKSGWSAGPWKRDLVLVKGKKLSLDDIEHKILRKKYSSPYIHYMVNCASIGCPNLLPELWDGETMEVARMTAAEDFINSPRGAKLDDGELDVSNIYKWFKEDFGGNEAGVLSHLSKHAKGDLLAAIEAGAGIDGYNYDWSLNAPEK